MQIHELPSKPGIYLLHNTKRNRNYIGQAKNIKERIPKHKNSANNKQNKNYYISASIAKHGWDSFDVEVLVTLEQYDKKLLDVLEKYYIKKYKTFAPDGYNLTKGGEGIAGLKHSEETKRKIGESSSQRNQGENNPMFGKKHTPETHIYLIECFRKASELNKKKIKQIDKKTGELIQIWNSITDATFALKQHKNGSVISHACNKRVKSAYGFKWEFVEKT